MSAFAQRITDSQARLVGLRDKLTEHLKSVDDSNVSDAEIDATNELNARIAQEEKGLASLKNSEKNLLLSSDSDNAAHSQSNGNGSGTALTLRPAARPFGIKPKQVDPLEYLVRDGVVRLLAHRERKNIDEVRRAIYGEDEATKAFIEYSAKAATAPAMTTRRRLGCRTGAADQRRLPGAALMPNVGLSVAVGAGPGAVLRPQRQDRDPDPLAHADHRRLVRR